MIPPSKMLSLSTRPIARRGTTLADALRTGRELGFKAVSIPLGGPAPRVGALAAALAETGSRVASLRAGCLDAEGNGRRAPGGLGAPDEGGRAAALPAGHPPGGPPKPAGGGPGVTAGGGA